MDDVTAAWTDLTDGVRLVASDLDGTLLRHDGSVSAFTVDTFARARTAGLPVVFVTGRPPRWMPEVVRATGHAGIGVCANGAIVLDLATERVLDAHPIGASSLDDVVATLRAEVPGVAFGVEWVPTGEPTPFAHEHDYLPRYPVAEAERADDVRDLARGRDVVKLLARVPSGHDADSFVAHALDHVAHLVTVTHSDSQDVLLEMSALGVTKGSTLATHAARLGVDRRQVAAVGDMPNDVPMVAWAGVGLAVESAHPDVRAAAAAVLPDPDDDGVARLVAAVLDRL
jgi:Cof subfamily protein (haloacid dehalogenase superfamily)